MKLMEKLGLTSEPVNWYTTGGNPRKIRLQRSKTPGSSKPREEFMSYTRDPKQFYLTTHKKDYTGAQGRPAGNARPRTSRIYPSRDDGGRSTYQSEYCGKFIPKGDSIRTGSASGNRRNNPHPSEAFMNWKFPSRLPPVDSFESTEAMEQVAQDHLKSTYQSDYTGIPQGVQMQHVFEGHLAPKLDKPPYTLDSTVRYDFQVPVLKPEFAGNMTRYGCNKNKYRPAVGAVPTVCYNSPHMHLAGRTSYSKDYVDKFPMQAMMNQSQKRYKSSASIPALEEFLKTAKPHEKQQLIKALKTIEAQDNRDTQGPDWLSQWIGPM